MIDLICKYEILCREATFFGMKKMSMKVLIFLYHGCAEFEVTVACWQIAESEDYDIVTIANEKSSISTNSGFTIIPDKIVSEIQITDNIAGLIIPGGSLLDLCDELRSLIQNLDNQNKLLAAICAGPQYFAAANVIGTRNFTTSRTPKRYIEIKQPDPFNWNQFLDKRVVVDENLITAKGYAYSDFAIEIWDYLGIIKSKEEKEERQRQMLSQTYTIKKVDENKHE
ncbi:MAG: thiamine biosynthesis protein ThiJ [Asgard group archaeon]|nr:thiamine biosynthesis protein ThiJ [Asgard group archaeon]